MRLFVFGIALFLTTWGAAQADGHVVPLGDLQEREGRFYQADAEAPYSGPFREAYPTGETRIAGTMLDGLPHGPSTSYLQNGLKTGVETFANGEKDGVSVTW